LFLFTFSLSFIFLRCNDQLISPTKKEVRQLSQQEKLISSSAENFGLKLFNKVNELEPNKNIFIAPLSASYALAMTLNGANGQTNEAIRTTLSLEGLSSDEINQSYKSLMQLLTEIDPKVNFLIANSIWYRNDMTFTEKFINTNKYFFNASITELDFGDPLAASIINRWVENNTNGKIKEIVDDPIDPEVVMFLINAIYFKGTWKYQFDPNYTKDNSFYLENGTTTNCKMMNQKSKFSYYQNDLFQAIDLLYGDRNFNMIILLPQPSKSTEDIVKEFNLVNWKVWLNSFSEKEVGLILPKFTLEYELELNDVLKQLGMEIAFSANADFTAMYEPGGLFISKVKHKTYVKVDEEGTEAAAVTSVEIIETASGIDEIIMMINHPFIFIIRDSNSNSILFIGKILDPTN
jgi:serpin B